MSISSEISRIQTNVASAYSALSAKGATMPDEQNTDNLAAAIESIQSGEAMSIETIRAICYVPSDFELNYTELEYIQSTGTQYIDTGFKPNQDTRVTMECEYDVTSAASWMYGARVGAGSSSFCFLSVSSKFRVDYEQGGDLYFGTSITKATTIDQNKNVTTVNGSEVITDTYAAFTCAYNIVLFAINTSGTISGRSSAKIYSCQIYNNGNLARDFVPCRRNSDSAVGLYDKVGKKFYGNAGSGAFTGG